MNGRITQCAPTASSCQQPNLTIPDEWYSAVRLDSRSWRGGHKQWGVKNKSCSPPPIDTTPCTRSPDGARGGSTSMGASIEMAYEALTDLDAHTPRPLIEASTITRAAVGNATLEWAIFIIDRRRSLPAPNLSVPPSLRHLSAPGRSPSRP
jgi:hypothetical protein